LFRPTVLRFPLVGAGLGLSGPPLPKIEEDVLAPNKGLGGPMLPPNEERRAPPIAFWRRGLPGEPIMLPLRPALPLLVRGLPNSDREGVARFDCGEPEKLRLLLVEPDMEGVREYRGGVL